MANKNNKWLRDKYYKALTQLGEQLTGRERLNALKKKWQNLREDYKAKGEKQPNLYTTAKDYEQQYDYEQTPRDENMNTEPAPTDLDEQSAQNVISDYEARIDAIYRRTLSYIDENKEGKGHAGGKLASIADFRRAELDDAYWTLKTQLQELKNSGVPLTIVAQAIQDNVELDYEIAISLMPPSDLVVDFEETTQQLFGVMQQIEARASELAEQAEREYYGQ